MTFKIGDKVRVVKDRRQWLDSGEGDGSRLPDDTILTVVNDTDGPFTVDYKKLEVNLSSVNLWPDDFEKVEEPVRFSVNMVDGPVNEIPAGIPIPITEGFISSKSIPAVVSLGLNEAGLGVYRPNLDDRKVGKVRVELVDDGFPLALREIAKVMTWAQAAKGYKDHDWQSLPNAEVALAAAASRHRTDHIKQRMVDGLFIKQCVDGESELLHKAHEAFGVLAQLELMLRGDIE